MTRIFWLLINLSLVAAALAVTQWVTHLEPASEGDAEIRNSRAGRRTPPRQPGRKFEREDSDTETDLSVQEFDELWERTLFRPERTEDVPKPEDEEGEEKEPEPTVDMELIGIGIIADKKAAIILVKPKAAPRRPARSRTPTSAARGAKEPAPSGPDKPKQRVYKVGQEIEDTGYEVKEITIDEVTLVRGDEERILKLEAGDEQSKNRRELAAKESEKPKEAPAEEKPPEATAEKPAGEEKKEASTPPPPPPPPVALPGGPGGGTGSGSSTPAASLSRDERIQRAREIRDRLLQRRSGQGKN